jgi:hypothetical protein
MSNSVRLAFVLSLGALSIPGAASARPTVEAPSAATRLGDQPKKDAEVRKKLAANLTILRSAITTCRQVAEQKAPANSDEKQRKGFEEQSTWLRGAATRISNAAASAQALLDKAGGGTVEELASMNMQFLALQEALQNESRKFQTLSNASKARHDTAMNSIRNMKG